VHFDLSPEQRAMRDGLRELCYAHAGSARARRYASGDDDGGALWGALTRAGWTGLRVAEEYGGQGLGTVELSLACEELARALAPGTFLGNAAAAALVERAGDESQRGRWLRGFAGGDAPGALGLLRRDGSGLVFDAERATAVILVDQTRAVIAPRTGVALEPLEGVDLTRRLQRVVLGDAEELRGDVAGGVDLIEVAVAAELVGVAQRALDLAVEHARTRQQFGRPIGAYQAVSHRCADMLLDVESARSAVLFAAWTADHNRENLPFAASVAKVAAAQGAWRVTTSSLQVHGGMGFTWDHDCHLLLRRAAASARLLGSVDEHLERVARLRGLGSSDVRRGADEVEGPDQEANREPKLLMPLPSH
jgi:alkylation response protein AidB-like acyl-CoA dehydrogenase